MDFDQTWKLEQILTWYSQKEWLDFDDLDLGLKVILVNGSYVYKKAFSALYRLNHWPDFDKTDSDTRTLVKSA